MGNTDTTIYMVDDMPLNCLYMAMKSKRLHGSCGYYYILKMRLNDYVAYTDEYIYVKVVDGDLYKYLQNKNDPWKFTVKRQREIDGSVVINIDGLCEWREYLNRETS